MERQTTVYVIFMNTHGEEMSGTTTTYNVEEMVVVEEQR